jgi:mRNA deadenylase 3'-5' endonuclease subunit Ccr4
MTHGTNLVDLYRKLRPLQIFPAVNSHNSQSLTVITYNLLSQHHINSEVYPYCISGVLRSAYRRTRIFAELQAYSPFDIAAFQEVGQFDEIWRAEWEKDGNKKAVYAAKEGGRDGIAVVYDSNKFELKYNEVLSFAPLMTALEAVPNIAQILVLNNVITKTNNNDVSSNNNNNNNNINVIVSNTHLFWRPDFDCLRVLQAHRLRKRIEELKSSEYPEHVIVMRGDWNSDPNSAVYHLISGQFNKITRSHWEDLINSHSALLGHPLELSQKLFNQVIEDFKKWPKLSSAYSLYKSPSDPASIGEPPYTSINSYVDTLDYIFVDFRKIKVSELLLMPPDEIVKKQTALPNEIYSSDHLALMAKFISI